MALALFAFALGTPSGATGGLIEPQRGTYAGAGARIDAPVDGMEVGFTFNEGMVDVRILGFTFPGCSGYTSVSDGPIAVDRFDLSGVGTMGETQRLKGRWVSRNEVRGKLILERPDPASCGEPGTWVYKYSARRYGGV